MIIKYNNSSVYLNEMEIKKQLINILSFEYGLEEATDQIETAKVYINGKMIIVTYDNFVIDIFREEDGEVVYFEHNLLSNNTKINELVKLSNTKIKNQIIRESKINNLMK